MLAQHPITGKAIRVMKTETHLYKNRNTLLWLREQPDQFAEPSRLSRWDTLTIGSAQSRVWKDALGTWPSAIVLRTTDQDTIDFLLKEAPKQRELLFLSKALMDAVTPDALRAAQFVNVMCIEELGEVFPFLHTKLNNTSTDAELVLGISLVFRASRLVGLTEQEQTSALAKLYQETYGLTYETSAVPECLVLITQLYTTPKARRQRELLKCYTMNVQNPLIDQILLLNETDMSTLPPSEKVQQITINKRLTYKDVIETIQTFEDDTIVVFGNADMYLTDSWRALWAVDLSNKFLSLLRYEESEDPTKEPELFGPRPDSQDLWVIRARDVKSRTWNLDALNFEFGRAGCDNAINVEMLKQRFIVANPCLTLKSIHCHRSNIRTYNPEDCIDKPFYLYLDPTGLHDLEPKRDLTALKKSWPQAKALTLKVNAADERHSRTFLKMAARDETIPLNQTLPITTLLTTTEETLYQVPNSFMTTNSLFYTYKSILMGQSDLERELWANETIGHVTPCIGVESVLGAPLNDTIASQPSSFLTKYLARLFRLNEAGHFGDFWLPREGKEIQQWLQLFTWPKSVMPVLPRDESIVAFAKQGTFLSPRSQSFVYTEEVEALRNRLRDYEEAPTSTTKQRIVICQDDVLLTTPIVSVLESALEEKGYLVDIIYPQRSNPSFLVESLVGANVCIAGPGCEWLYWVLPRKVRVIECLSETKINAYGLAMAAAADLDYFVVLVPKGSPTSLAPFVQEKVLASLDVDLQRPKRPTLYLPEELYHRGFHAHSGDSFRSMAREWHKRGYVNLEPTTSPYCWLNAVGDVLLYDRANYDWLDQTPADYKHILCGNPDASLVPRGIQWNFWPRRPDLVEQLAYMYAPTPFNERPKTLVFYGKVENMVQRNARSSVMELWDACDDFDMPVGEKEQYKYTPREYLKALSKSKFGLCMAGFGPKCNREVELMAMGTVPVVARGVDMVKYANPPQEGIHYLRVVGTTAEELKQQLAEVTEEQWTKMSVAAHQWWKENASVEGLWNVTQQLLKN